MATSNSINRANGYLDDIHISEADKLSEWYLKENIDSLIHTLVREKTHIKTYRNYYNGIRDEKEFEYLTNNFGIGSPSKLNFTPLIKPRVDALVGSITSDSFDYQTTCSDDKSIQASIEQRKNSRLDQMEKAVSAFIQSNVSATQQAGQMGQQQPAAPQPGQQPPQQPDGGGEGGMSAGDFQQSIKRVEDLHGNNFLSSFEIAGKDLIQFFSQDVKMDMDQKRKQIAMDLISTGESYYRVHIEEVGADPIFTVVKPENLFYNKNTNSQYVDTTDGIVHREFLTKKAILHKYGKYMSEEQKQDLFGEAVRNVTGISLSSGSDIDRRYRYNEMMTDQMSMSSLDTMEVFHCEFLAMNAVDLDEEEREDQTQVDGYQAKVNKKGYRMDRYEGVKIGEVYVNCGKSRHIARSETSPMDCGFTYGGIVHNDRNGKPFSVVGALKDLQDVYDLTIFYRDNLISNSGVPGSRVNIAGIPKQLGHKFMDRLMKYVAMKKNGFELIDPTEPGAQMFQHYGEFDNSVNGSSLAAIENTLLSMERQADLIASTNKQMLGQIAERDAVDNVKQGITQSLMINAELFDLIRTNQKRFLTDMLKASKICYSKGKRGSYIVGSESFIFNLLPENISYTDLAINITYSSKDKEKLVALKMLAKELVAGGMIDPDTLVHIILSDSVTEVKYIMDKAWAIKKQETSQTSQAQSEVEQLQQQIQQLTGELTKAQQQMQAKSAEDKQFKERELNMKESESEAKLGNDRRKIDITEDYNNKQIDVKKEIAQLEREQLYLGANGPGTGTAAEPKNNLT